jgi:hypothetical protein
MMTTSTQPQMLPVYERAAERLGKEARELFRQMTSTRNGRRVFGRQWHDTLETYRQLRAEITAMERAS